MPGAWEIRQQQSVLCAVLHTDTTTIAWGFGLRNLQIPGPVIGLAGMPFDQARNVACMKALEIGASFLFFLDSDVVPPHDAVPRLMARNQPIISGVYCRRSPPVGVPVMMRNRQWVTDIPQNTVIDVDVVGAGCLLIRRDVLEQMPPQRPGKHWFDWRVDLQGTIPPEECMSEDFTFCMWAKKTLGITIKVDTSIQCRHVGFSQAVYGGFQALDVVPVH